MARTASGQKKMGDKQSSLPTLAHEQIVAITHLAQSLQFCYPECGLVYVTQKPFWANRLNRPNVWKIGSTEDMIRRLRTYATGSSPLLEDIMETKYIVLCKEMKRTEKELKVRLVPYL